MGRTYEVITYVTSRTPHISFWHGDLQVNLCSYCVYKLLNKYDYTWMFAHMSFLLLGTINIIAFPWTAATACLLRLHCAPQHCILPGCASSSSRIAAQFYRIQESYFYGYLHIQMLITAVKISVAALLSAVHYSLKYYISNSPVM